jgi:MerR family redox-sensitive transcriptional activator SoxR
MAQLTISEVAREAGLAPSAIRYYEDAGVLPRPRRVGGQRRYDDAVLSWLAVVRRAQYAGFTLDEVRTLLFGFRKGAPLSARWRKLAAAKIVELDGRIEEIQSMKDLLLSLQSRCHCTTVEECGAAIRRNCAK